MIISKICTLGHFNPWQWKKGLKRKITFSLQPSLNPLPGFKVLLLFLLSFLFLDLILRPLQFSVVVHHVTTFTSEETRTCPKDTYRSPGLSLDAVERTSVVRPHPPHTVSHSSHEVSKIFNDFNSFTMIFIDSVLRLGPVDYLLGLETWR